MGRECDIAKDSYKLVVLTYTCLDILWEMYENGTIDVNVFVEHTRIKICFLESMNVKVNHKIIDLNKGWEQEL